MSKIIRPVQARSHRYSADFEYSGVPVGAGLPAKQAMRCMARALPVIAGQARSHRGPASLLEMSTD
ncbi:hypothetical protein EGT09_01780 [Pseudomonas putida]|nr:hypothetical protein EGT09_01780 [Pseudomonas putida]